MAIFQKKIAYPHEYFNNIDDYKKPVDNLKKENFFSKLKNKCPNDNEMERTKQKEINKYFDLLEMVKNLLNYA